VLHPLYNAALICLSVGRLNCGWPEMHKVSNLPIADRLTLRVNDAASYAGIGRSLIYRLIAEDKLQTTKIGGRRLILRESLENLLRGRKAG
jgi:excisionase family DNA binding protein